MNTRTPAQVATSPAGDAVFGHVLVGIDETPESLVAVAQAGVLRAPGGRLMLLAVRESHLAAHAGLGALRAADFANWWLNLAILWELGLLLLVVNLPMLQDAFGTTGLSLDAWLIVVGAAVTIVPELEFAKFALRRASTCTSTLGT